ncbi:MAG: GntR family transcriptional regulator [Oscillospiraceae bacterium]|nr:GntR family transcriptional regulator [Oscillospiraceae bacterium]
MDWIIDKSRPICPQICEQLCLRVAAGQFAPHEKILSVREIAVAAGFNPNTVQRSLEELEGKGVLYSVRGSGWFVGEDIAQAKEVLSGILAKKTADYFAAMQILGMDAAAVKEYVKEWKE